MVSTRSQKKHVLHHNQRQLENWSLANKVASTSSEADAFRRCFAASAWRRGAEALFLHQLLPNIDLQLDFVQTFVVAFFTLLAQEAVQRRTSCSAAAYLQRKKKVAFEKKNFQAFTHCSRNKNKCQFQWFMQSVKKQYSCYSDFTWYQFWLTTEGQKLLF